MIEPEIQNDGVVALTQFHLTPAFSFATLSCAASGCGREVKQGEVVMIDSLGEVTYCHPCGINLRFHRKRAGQRHEKLPVTFQDVDERLKT